MKQKLVWREGVLWHLNTFLMNVVWRERIFHFLSVAHSGAEQHLSFSSNTPQPSKQSPDILTLVFIYQPSPCTCHMTLFLRGKHLRVNCSKGMLADKTKCFALEEGQCSSSTAERERGRCYTGLASQCAFLFHPGMLTLCCTADSLNDMWVQYLWCIPCVR